MIKPVPERDAAGEVKAAYDALKKSLPSSSLPLFFTYLGAFPDYLIYITDQLKSNLADENFKELAADTAKEIATIIHGVLDKGGESADWLNRHRQSPAFYNFNRDLNTVYLMNMKLGFVFIALREAVKGWAVAAKKLDYREEFYQREKVNTVVDQEKFVYEDIPFASTVASGSGQASLQKPILTHIASGLVKREKQPLQADMLRQYLRLCRQDFHFFMKHDSFWTMRVGIEKIVLASLPLFPNLIFSPINVVLELTKKYPDFADLLHLLTEHFPTYAMQRLIFSGYMID